MFRVMTVNIWDSGTNVKNGLEKLAEFINLKNPDVVGLQEIRDKKTIPILLDRLNKMPGGNERTWFGHSDHDKLRYPDTGFLYQHPVATETLVTRTIDATGTKILLPSKNGISSKNLTMISVHLTAYSYGPYAATNRLCTSPAQILAGELQDHTSKYRDKYSRVASTKNMIASDGFQAAMNGDDSELFILMGDFNSPSHLDWIESTKESHCGWVFEWPVSKLIESTGLKDSYRELFPDPLSHPGITWSPIVKQTCSGEWQSTIPEPQDRLDYIFYKSGGLKPVVCEIFHGLDLELNKPFPNHKENLWPSDHSALIVDFEIE